MTEKKRTYWSVSASEGEISIWCDTHRSTSFFVTSGGDTCHTIGIKAAAEAVELIEEATKLLDKLTKKENLQKNLSELTDAERETALKSLDAKATTKLVASVEAIITEKLKEKTDSENKKKEED